nr:tubby-related protein 1-like isoform X2 [Ipomoea batatas]
MQSNNNVPRSARHLKEKYRREQMKRLYRRLASLVSTENSLVCSEPLVTPEALLEIGCVRGVPLPPPPQPLVPRLLVLSSEESRGSEGDVVEGEESSSGASDPDYRVMSDEAENARAVLAAYRSQNSKRARRGEPSRSRVPRAAPRSSPPGQAPVPRSRHSSASTTADNPAPGFAASAPGFAAPMGSTFAMPSASPSWPMSIPPSVSLLQGDVPAEDAMVRYGAMGDALEVEAKARQELESQMGSLNLQCEQLSFQHEQMALRERRALEGQRAAEERSAMAVSRYRESSAFPVDVRAYISEHVEESYDALKATRAGSRYVAMESAHMADIGEYDMQHKIYTQLRCRDPSFDPEAWGLPLELIDPEPQIETAASHGASGTGAALGDDPFPGLALGLGGAADIPLDQIRLSPGMVNFDQAGTSGARNP